MKTKKKYTTSADAANKFVLNLLSNLGEKLGGINDKEWKEPLEFFGNSCAYTKNRQK